jgi:two-component system LytT family response regulator
MRILIVDDEANARENLKLRLNRIDPSLILVGEAENVEEAYAFIQSTSIDLIFLDVEMPGGNGFSLLKKLSSIDFEVIFVTAYSEYAMQAFDHLALGYVTKPIDNELLTKAYLKAKNRKSNSLDIDVISRLTQEIKGISRSSKLAIPIDSGLQLVDIDTIITLESSDGYVIFTLTESKKIVSSKRLTYFEHSLANNHFIRIHRSFLVNRDFVESYHKIGFIKLTNGAEIPVSRNFRSDVSRILKERN